MCHPYNYELSGQARFFITWMILCPSPIFSLSKLQEPFPDAKLVKNASEMPDRISSILFFATRSHTEPVASRSNTHGSRFGDLWVGICRAKESPRLHSLQTPAKPLPLPSMQNEVPESIPEHGRQSLNNLMGDVYHPYGSACSQKQTDYTSEITSSANSPSILFSVAEHKHY